MNAFVSQELCSFTALENLSDKGPFDCIFSNFAGLNCTGDLQKVLASFDYLLKPGGKVVLVVLPGFCLWETLLMFRGKFKTASPAFFLVPVEERQKLMALFFTCWYYSPGFIRRALNKKFESRELEDYVRLSRLPISKISPKNFQAVWLVM